MRDVLRVCLVFTLLVSLSSFHMKAEADDSSKENLIVNGSFEETVTTNKNIWKDNLEPEGWGVWIPSGNPQLSVDQDTFLKGDQSIRIDATTISRADVLQDVPIIPEKNYKFKVWVKTDNVEASWGGAYVRTQYLDRQGRKISDGPSTERLQGSNDWSLQEMNVSAPPNVAKIRIELFLETATGTVWFDDVSLEETDEVFLTGFALKESALTLEKGETFTLTPIFTPEDAADKTITWESDNSNVATVNDQGLVTAVDYGYTTIKAKSRDGGFEAQTLISVESSTMIKAYDQLRIKWSNKLTGNELYDPNDPDMVAFVSDLDSRLTNEEKTGRWDTMNKAEDRKYLWDFLQSTTDSSQISWAYGIIRDMAQAYSMKGSSLYQNEELKQDIIGALDWMYENRYNENKNSYGNWWDWEIGTPQILNNIVVLMYDDLSPAQIDKQMRTIDRFVPDPTKRLNNVTETGANLLDKALVVTLRGVIGKSGAKISQGSESIGDEFRYVTHGDGVYEDGSLVQHSVIAYTGSYGAVWMNRAADMLYLLNDSPWHVTDNNVNNVYNWVPDSFEPLIYKGAMMDMVRGRAISRENERDHKSGRGIILSILRLSQSAPPEKEQLFKSMVKEWIETDSTTDNYAEGLSIYEMSMVKSLMNDTSIESRGELVKHQVFAGMDRVVHLRPEFGFGLSMFSDRISAFSYGNGENKHGWHTGAGMTYIYNDDLTHYSNDYWPTIDSYRLPGTTTDHSKGTLVAWKSYLNPRKWIGGSSMDGIYGATGMDFSLEASTGSSLQGKKSWFMFDDEIVALGSDIKSKDNHQVETIIENRQLNDSGDNQLTMNGQVKSAELGWSETVDATNWAHLQGNVANSDIGYFFPENSDVYALRESRTGSWNDVNDGGSKEQITRNYLSLAIDHGVKPENETYSYVLLPNKNVDQTESYSQNPDISILSKTSAVHAVREHTLGMIAANFWSEGTVEFIRAHQPASVIVKEEGNELTLSVSDPTKIQNTIVIDIGRKGLSVVSKDESVTVSQMEPTTRVEIDVSGSLGKTHTVKLEYAPYHSANDIKRLIEQFEEDGEFTNNQVSHSLKLHMTAVNHLESQKETKKVVKHMEGFYMLLDRYSKEMSEYAYNLLERSVASLLGE